MHQKIMTIKKNWRTAFDEEKESGGLVLDSRKESKTSD